MTIKRDLKKERHEEPKSHFLAESKTKIKHENHEIRDFKRKIVVKNIKKIR